MRTLGRNKVERTSPISPDVDFAEHPDAPAPAGAPVTLFVCITCGARPEGDGPSAGEALRDAAITAAGEDPGLAVAPVKCLSNCKRALSAAITRADGWSYVFGDLGPHSADDLVIGARLLSASEDGLMPWRGRPDSLKRGMVARIPPLPAPVSNAEERS